MRTSANGKRPHLERTRDAAEAAVNPRNLRLKRGRRRADDDAFPARRCQEGISGEAAALLLPGSCTMQQQL